MIRERAPAKANLLLHVGPRREDGLHELCSLFASIELCDDVLVEEAPEGEDRVLCDGVEGPNLGEAALAAFRSAAGAELPPLRVTIEKRIPVAAGLGGGSADAAAVLRAANELAGRPLGADALRAVAARLGSDVPSQVAPRNALVAGAGEVVEPLELPPMTLVLAPDREGLGTREVFAEADRLGLPRDRLDVEAVRALAAKPLPELVERMENDLEPAALSLRPGLDARLRALRQGGALAALVAGSGPTVLGVFERRADAERAAAGLPGALVAGVRTS
jgi:4-diphosphocytidyl-2-C-methyl-D-erythritol kinase